jgi:hypothetical protein
MVHFHLILLFSVILETGVVQMAQIQKRTLKNGSISYVAKIAIRKNGKWAYREARSFDKLAKAKIGMQSA